MALGPDKKLGLLRDTSIQPFRPKEETFEIPVPKGINEITVAVRLTYQPRPGNIYPPSDHQPEGTDGYSLYEISVQISSLRPDARAARRLNFRISFSAGESVSLVKVPG